jgi:hypothetical protein
MASISAVWPFSIDWASRTASAFRRCRSLPEPTPGTLVVLDHALEEQFLALETVSTQQAPSHESTKR